MRVARPGQLHAGDENPGANITEMETLKNTPKMETQSLPTICFDNLMKES